MLPIFLEGFLLQASLILALGAQNIFVLESGLKARKQFVVAATCSICDIILVLIGVLGTTTLFAQFPSLKIIFGIVGVGFLFYYGALKLYDAYKNMSDEAMHGDVATTSKKAILLSLGFSLLNPHVYLDTLILIGGYASKFPTMNTRLIFGLGAGTFSTIWFFGLVLFSSMFKNILDNKNSMRIVSLVSGVVLIILSWKLGEDVYSWL